MRNVPISKARTHLSSLVRSLDETGEAVATTRNGRVTAHLTPLSEADLRRIEQLRAAKTKGAVDA